MAFAMQNATGGGGSTSKKTGGSSSTNTKNNLKNALSSYTNTSKSNSQNNSVRNNIQNTFNNAVKKSTSSTTKKTENYNSAKDPNGWLGDHTITTNGGSSGGSSSGSTYVDNSASDYNNALLSAYDSYMSELSALRSKIEEYQSQRDKLAEENYQAQLSANAQSAKEQRNQANLNSARTDRWLKAQYGGGLSGQGLTNRLRNKTNLTNTLASIDTNLANNNASANLSRYNTLSSNLDDTISRLQTIDDSSLNARLKYINYLNNM